LDEYEETPWDALKYLIASVNYGGHVTDEWDMRLIQTYITGLFKEEALIPFFKYVTLPKTLKIIDF
jgi:dynein heavy chain